MSGRLFRVEHVDTNDEGDLQTSTLLGPQGETLKRVPRVMPFGLHSSVPSGSHGMALQFGAGGRTLKAVLGLEHQDHRPRKREVGSTALYDANGNTISLVQSELRWTGKKASVIESGDTVTVSVGALKIIVSKGRIDLGAPNGSPVMTQAGPSSVVFAKV